MSFVNREMGAGGQVLAPERLSKPMVNAQGAPISRSARVGGTSDRRSVEGHAEASGLVITGRIRTSGQSGTDLVIRQADTHPSRLAGIKPRRRSLVPSFVPLPDIPAGCFKVQGVVSAHNRNAATVTQAGGLNGLPAFSAQAPAGKRAGTEEPASGEALRVPETLGGVLGPVGGF